MQGSILLACCTARPASCGAWDGVISSKTAPVLASEVLPLTLPLQSPGELSLLLAPAIQGVPGCRGTAAASGEKGDGGRRL